MTSLRSLQIVPTFPLARDSYFSLRRMTSGLGSTDKSILQCLSVIIDPDLHRDIVSLGFVKNLNADVGTGVVSFDLELTTPACPVKEQFVTACNEALKANLSWVKEVKVNLTARARQNTTNSSAINGLSRVNSIIAVSSCKGGVGKSSVALHLARTLREKFGAKVGLLDADIYGPSLPTLLPRVRKGPFDEALSQQVQVFETEDTGLKVMSIGYLKPGESLALRGPMVSGIVGQILSNTGWGELDYLVIDMPPGTGDIHLTIGQQAAIDGAVIVTTPQELSVVDVEKGIELFNKMKIPSIALVENFSYFTCNQCDAKHELFGRSGDAKKIGEKFGIENIFQIPITQSFQDENISKCFSQIAEAVVREISKLKYAGGKISVNVLSGDFKLMENEKVRAAVPFRQLRMNCKSASMIDEWTGEKRFRDEDIALDVKPTKVEPAGNYAFRVDWSDGHHSIYPIKAIIEMA